MTTTLPRTFTDAQPFDPTRDTFTDEQLSDMFTVQRVRIKQSDLSGFSVVVWSIMLTANEWLDDHLDCYGRENFRQEVKETLVGCNWEADLCHDAAWEIVDAITRNVVDAINFDETKRIVKATMLTFFIR